MNSKIIIIIGLIIVLGIITIGITSSQINVDDVDNATTSPSEPRVIVRELSESVGFTDNP